MPPVTVSPVSAISTFGATLLRVLLTALVQLVDDVASSNKLETAKEDHLKDSFLRSKVSWHCRWQECSIAQLFWENMNAERSCKRGARKLGTVSRMVV
jgi:hypothetical protein